MSSSSRRRARKTQPGVIREDSDDELGDDDIPWRWIRREGGAGEGPGPEDAGDICAARLGEFECRIGDAVLLKADGPKEAWVGLVWEFLDDDDGEMAAKFVWFSTEKEIRSQARKRTDFIPNELYVTPSWDINPLTAINGKAAIMSPASFAAEHPSGRIPRSSKQFGKVFICRRGCDTRTAIYTDEFCWEDIYGGTKDDLDNLVKMVTRDTKPKRARARRRSRSPPPSPPQHDARSRPTPMGTPQKRSPTKKSLEFTPLATRELPREAACASPFQLARANLHVSAVPTSLPCRESEFAEVYSRLTEAIADGTGNCFYISGTPGTGKTATVREVVSHLEAAVQSDELEDFIFVEINGMKITDPYQSYALLWEALRGERVSASQALELLEREFSHPSPRRLPCVVLMDELDQLVTKNQGVMYNFFNWPSLRHSRLIVLAVANTMDLPERTLSNKISSRLGLTRITFPGYTHDQLMKIIQSRLHGVPGNIVDPDAIQFASRKVAAVSGDARRALDICRRAVELAECGSGDGESGSTPSRRNRGVAGAAPTGQQQQYKVTIATVKKAISEATSSPVQQHIRSLPLLVKVLLVALTNCLRRTGLTETTVGELADETTRITESGPTRARLVGMIVAASSSSSKRGTAPGGKEYWPPFRLGSAVLDLASAGIVTAECLKTDRPSKLRLAVGLEDIRMALRGDGEVEGLGLRVG